MNYKRILTMIVSILLIAALLPTAALAATYELPFYSELYDDPAAEEDDLVGTGAYSGKVTAGEGNTTVTVHDFEKYIIEGEKYYRLVGINSFSTHDPKTAVTIPEAPTDPAALAAWLEEWSLYLAYVPHTHYSDYWYANNTNHWQHCDGCWTQFNMNWHWDRDENGICDDCTDKIHYYTITIADCEGGTVTVSQDKAMLNDRVDVTVTPDEGYVLKQICFYNDNKMHSQLTRYEDVRGSEYHFIVIPWDVEVVAEFVKAE